VRWGQGAVGGEGGESGRGGGLSASAGKSIQKEKLTVSQTSPQAPCGGLYDHLEK